MSKQVPEFLIVDDEPDMCWVLQHLLERRGFQTRQASSGQEALNSMVPGRFQTVFLDAKLPDIEGLKLAVQLRNIDPTVRIVMISGYFYRTDKDVRKAVAKKLISGFISKPFIHGEVLSAIKET